MKRARVLELLGLKDSDALQAAALDQARMLHNSLPDGIGYIEECARQYEVPEEKFRQAARDLMVLLFAIADEPACRVCGCTHYEPCDDGCSWVLADLCSSCVCGARAKWGVRELVCVLGPDHKRDHESIGGHLWKDSDRRAIVPRLPGAKTRKAARRAR